MSVTVDQIREYYDRNTALFLRFGSSQRVASIHRALWMGATNLTEALDTSNRMMLEAARQIEAEKIADLGCGVGATLFYLLSPEHGSAEGRWKGVEAGFGLTLSRFQAQQAAHAAARLALAKAHILQADFQSLPLVTGFDLAYCIEAFVHATRPDDYLSEAARILRPGGRLVILDDFLGEMLTHQAPDALAAHWLRTYQRGWHAPNLRLPAEVEEQAACYGLALVETRDLTPFLRLRALPDGMARWLVALFQPLWSLHPIIPSMLGSLALQQCLAAGLVEYRWLVFEKR